jgi:hypothetical protein
MIYRHLEEATKSAKGIQFVALYQGRQPLAKPQMPHRLPSCRTEPERVTFS